MKTHRIAHAATLAALILVFAVVPAALAAKGGGGGNGGGGTTSGSSSITGPFMVTDTGAPGLSFSDTVTFQVSTTATTQPFVHLVCWGNGIGYNSWKGVFAGSLDTNWNFVLGSGGWTSGAADCTAWLGMYTKQGFKQLASTTFHVDA